MKIHEKRLLRGPNLYADGLCLMAVVGHVGAGGIGFSARLRALLPTLRLNDDAAPVDALGPVLMALQDLAGVPGDVNLSLPVAGHLARRRIVCGYQVEAVAVGALRTATALLDALAADRPFDLDAALAALRATAAEYALDAGTSALIDAARRRGIPALRIAADANLFKLGWGSRQKRLDGTLTSSTSAIAVGIAGDKALTRTLLEQAGVPVPAGGVVTRLEDAQRLARRLGGAVVVKPLGGSGSRGVTVGCSTPDAVARAFEHARRQGRRVIVEALLPGRDYRVLVVGDQVVAACRWRAPVVTGDGVSTLRQLVANETPGAMSLDASALAGHGHDCATVLASGVRADLRGDAHGASRGMAEDVTDLLPEATRALCIRAARTIGLDVAGIDIVCDDIMRPLREGHGGIIAVSAAPDIRPHESPSRGTPRAAGDAIVAALFDGCDGRIPLVAVTGTNGKTTTSLLIEHTVRLAGLRTGLTTTGGVYLNGRLAYEGDCTGYHSARSVLGAPEVDFAVLETARGGILKRGLAYDRCDVAVVLNVSADHLGLDGIDTIEDLARVKAVVARRASRAVVLNAEDAYCVTMAAELNGDAEIVYFALDAEDPVLVRHLEHGGRGVYLQDAVIVLAGGTRHEALLDVREMPVSLGGRARYNIANAMAAVAALTACGFGNDEIVSGLRTFVSDSKHNPLRSNLFDVDGVTVIVDYAHNCAAYAALSEMARAMSPGRLVGVVAAPGDRRDADLIDIGRTCAAGFDDLVIYESEHRGRQPGATAAFLTRGARLGKIGAEQLHVEPNVHRAIRLGLSLCRPGDVLVFGCGSSLSELTEALRPTRPDLAHQIESAAT